MKDLCEINLEVRSLVKAYMTHQTELAALLQTGHAEHIKAKQAQVRQEKRKLAALLKQGKRPAPCSYTKCSSHKTLVYPVVDNKQAVMI